MLKSLLAWILQHKNIAVKAISGLFVGLLLISSIFLYNKNKKLTQSLELASNNIECYQGIVNGEAERNNVLMLSEAQLKQMNDSLIKELNKKAEESKIKTSNINTAATQHQSITVSGCKGVGVDTIYVNTPTGVYSDSIKFNDFTTVYYDIQSDTVAIQLDIQNTQYLYTYKQRQWKNKKNFLQRLFTLDFKKVWKYNYQIINTNELINTSDVRVIELTN